MPSLTRHHGQCCPKEYSGQTLPGNYAFSAQTRLGAVEPDRQ